MKLEIHKDYKMVGFTLKFKRIKYGISLYYPIKFWCDIWTPVWHDNRGKYITIGIGFITFQRGY